MASNELTAWGIVEQSGPIGASYPDVLGSNLTSGQTNLKKNKKKRLRALTNSGSYVTGHMAAYAQRLKFLVPHFDRILIGGILNKFGVTKLMLRWDSNRRSRLTIASANASDIISWFNMWVFSL